MLDRTRINCLFSKVVTDELFITDEFGKKLVKIKYTQEKSLNLWRKSPLLIEDSKGSREEKNGNVHSLLSLHRVVLKIFIFIL